MVKKTTKCCAGKIVGVYRRQKLQGFMCNKCQKTVKNNGDPGDISDNRLLDKK